MSDQSWWNISIEIPSAFVEPALAVLEARDVGAIVEQDTEDGATRLTFATQRPNLGSLGQALRDLPIYFPQSASSFFSRVTITPVSTVDWSQHWRQWFQPLECAPGIWVKPSWAELPCSARGICIEIDPGQAFGVGSHETTQLCLKIIQQQESCGSLGRVLDVGTGTGILSIAAAKLGATSVVAIDTDPLSRETALHNFKHNRVTPTAQVVELSIEQIKGSFDLVVANLTAEDLVQMASVLADRVCSGGRLAVSGILQDQPAIVREAFEAQGLQHRESLVQGEWTAEVFVNG